MGTISKFFKNEPKTVKNPPAGITGWIKIEDPKGAFFYKLDETRSGVQVTVKEFEEAGTERTVDIKTGTVITRKYEDFRIWYFNYQDEEKAGTKLLSDFNYSRMYRSGNPERVFLDE